MDQEMPPAYNKQNTRLEHLAFAFLIARRSEKINQHMPQKTVPHSYETHAYFEKETNKFIYLTKRQHQCLWSYHQHRNIKAAATNVGLAARTAEEHLKLARKKFQMQKLTILMSAIDQRLVEYVDER